MPSLQARIQDAMGAVDGTGTFTTAASRTLRDVVGEFITAGNAVPVHPRDLFGPWDDLPTHQQEVLRKAIEAETRWAMDALPRGRFWPGLVGRYHGFQERGEALNVPPSLLGVGKRLEGIAWSGYGTARERLKRRSFEKTWRGAGRLTVEHLLHALGWTPHWLLGDYATGVTVDSRCRGFHYQRDRNVTFGYLLGLDLLPSNDGFWCVEANLSTAFNEERRDILDPEPAIEVLLQTAEELGARHVQWYGPEWTKTAWWLVQELQETAERTGIDARIFHGYRFPKTGPVPPGLRWPERFVTLPNDQPPDTVVLRRNAYPVGSDHLVSDKGPFTRSVQAQLTASGDDRVRVPAMSTDPADAFSEPVEGLPNLVYKYPWEGKGEGVHFLKVATPGEATALARRLDGESGKSPGLFQPFVCPRILPGNRIYDIRCEVFVTPHGVKHVFSTRREAMQPLPETLDYGLVEQKGVFTSNLSTGGRFWHVDPSEAEGTKQAALAVGEAIVDALNHTFRTIE